MKTLVHQVNALFVDIINMIVFVIAHLNLENFSVSQWKKNIIIAPMRMETDIEKYNPYKDKL